MNFKILFFISFLFLAACQTTTTKKNLPTTKPAATDIIEKTSNDIKCNWFNYWSSIRIYNGS